MLLSFINKMISQHESLSCYVLKFILLKFVNKTIAQHFKSLSCFWKLMNKTIVQHWKSLLSCGSWQHRHFPTFITLTKLVLFHNSYSINKHQVSVIIIIIIFICYDNVEMNLSCVCCGIMPPGTSSTRQWSQVWM